METKPKTVVIVFGSEDYDTDAPLHALATKLKKDCAFTTAEQEATSFLMGEMGKRKVAVISEKFASWPAIELWLVKAINYGCEDIFVSTPHHGDVYNTVSGYAQRNGNLRIETSPTVVKYRDWEDSLKQYQDSLDGIFANMLFNLI